MVNNGCAGLLWENAEIDRKRKKMSYCSKRRKRLPFIYIDIRQSARKQHSKKERGRESLLLFTNIYNKARINIIRKEKERAIS